MTKTIVKSGSEELTIQQEGTTIVLSSIRMPEGIAFRFAIEAQELLAIIKAYAELAKHSK